jgi:hypothetical protein
MCYFFVDHFEEENLFDYLSIFCLGLPLFAYFLRLFVEVHALVVSFIVFFLDYSIKLEKKLRM